MITPTSGLRAQSDDVFDHMETARRVVDPSPRGDSFDDLRAPDLAGSFERQFASIIRSLGQQLQKLERTFASAMRDLSRSLKTSTSPREPVVKASAAAPRAASRFMPLIRKAAADHDLDPNLLTSVIEQESGFDPHAVSSAGARGLMQLMPDTARSLGVSDPFDPRQNVEAGATLLRQLIDKFGGRLDLALAAYNAGSGAVEKYGGIPPYRETQAYVKDILANYRAASMS